MVKKESKYLYQKQTTANCTDEGKKSPLIKQYTILICTPSTKKQTITFCKPHRYLERLVAINCSIAKIEHYLFSS